MSYLTSVVFDLWEVMMIEALEGLEEGVLVGGQLVSDVRFIDDQGMVANTESGLQSQMNKLNNTAKNYGMKITAQKIKTIVVRWMLLISQLMNGK